MAERILVVDDEEIIRESIAMILEKEGYKVDKAENGGSAFEKISAISYDLVITDLKMKPVNGLEILKSAILASKVFSPDKILLNRSGHVFFSILFIKILYH